MHATNEKANTQKAEKLLECLIALEKEWALRGVCILFLLDQTLIDGMILFVLCNYLHDVYRKNKQNEV